MSTASTSRRVRLSNLIAAQVAAVAPASTGKLDIAGIHLFPIREPVSQRQYSVVRVRTRGGITGFGEGPQASATDLAEVQTFWMGRPATSYVTSGSPLRLSGAINMALLDIIGKSCKAPIYRLLGGPTRNKARAFTSLTGATTSEKLVSLGRASAAGYRAFSVTVPQPAARNQGQAYQRDVRQMLEALRSGPNAVFDFVLDGRAALTPGDAASVAATVEPLHPLWFDEPCAVSNLQTIRKIADESVVPLGFGRDISDPGVYQQLLRDSVIDVVRPDIGRNGITPIRRIAALAEPYYIAVAPRHEGGPIATAAALHLAATLPNFFIQHIPLPEAEEDTRARAALVPGDVELVREGFAALPAGPGLGITVNEAALEKYHAA